MHCRLCRTIGIYQCTVTVNIIYLSSASQSKHITMHCRLFPTVLYQLRMNCNYAALVIQCTSKCLPIKTYKNVESGHHRRHSAENVDVQFTCWGRCCRYRAQDDIYKYKYCYTYISEVKIYHGERRHF